MTRRVAPGAAVALALLGCAGAALAAPSVQMATLQPGDVPAGFKQTLSVSCSAACVRKQYGTAPQGLVSAWETDYQDSVKLIGSIAVLFADQSSAHRQLQAWYRCVEQYRDGVRVPVTGRVGDESRVYRLEIGGTIAYAAAWRHGRFNGIAVSGGLVERVASADRAMALARKQELRFKRAAP